MSSDASIAAPKARQPNAAMQGSSADVKNPDDELELPQRYESIIITFSELADKYWNGSKSLLKNKRFKSE